MRKLFKGGNYSREETIRGNTVRNFLDNTLFQFWLCWHFFWLFYLKANDNAAYIWVIKQNKNMKGCHWH